jgi:hypothetical protein
MDKKELWALTADNATIGFFLFSKCLPLPMNEIVSFFIYPIGVVCISISQE